MFNIVFAVFATAQTVLERKFRVVSALVVSVLLDQLFVSLLVRLQPSGM